MIAKAFSPAGPMSFTARSDALSLKGLKRFPRMVRSAPRGIAESARAIGVLVAAFTTPPRSISGACAHAATVQQNSQAFASFIRWCPEARTS